MVTTRQIMDSVDGWPDLQMAEDKYICGKLMQVCTVERNRSLYAVAVKEHIMNAGRGRLPLLNLEYNYVVWRDYHRTLPLAETIEMLRLYLREEQRWLPIKFSNVAMFFLGAIGQYSKARYKLRGTDLKSYVWTESFRRVHGSFRRIQSQNSAFSSCAEDPIISFNQ